MRVPPIAIALALAGVGTLAACNSLDCSLFECGACPPALTVNVTSAADGGPVAGVEVTGLDGTCSDGVCVLSASNSGDPAGLYSFQLVAPGFLPLSMSETISAVEIVGCCGCGYDWKTVDAGLTPQ